MQPQQQNNYWQSGPENSEQTEKIDMYTPSPDDNNENSQPATTNNGQIRKSDFEPVHWSASEYIHNEKDGLWYIIFGLVVIALIAFDVFILKSYYTFSVLVVVMAASLIIFSRRPPRMIDYTLSINQGLYISDRLYHFNDFKAFGLIKDGNQNSIMLIPNKRFNPGVSVYFPEDVGEKIVDILGARLPMENLKLDMIDILVRKLRL